MILNPGIDCNLGFWQHGRSYYGDGGTIRELCLLHSYFDVTHRPFQLEAERTRLRAAADPSGETPVKRGSITISSFGAGHNSIARNQVERDFLHGLHGRKSHNGNLAQRIFEPLAGATCVAKALHELLDIGVVSVTRANPGESKSQVVDHCEWEEACKPR